MNSYNSWTNGHGVIMHQSENISGAELAAEYAARFGSQAISKLWNRIESLFQGNQVSKLAVAEEALQILETEQQNRGESKISSLFEMIKNFFLYTRTSLNIWYRNNINKEVSGMIFEKGDLRIECADALVSTIVLGVITAGVHIATQTEAGRKVVDKITNKLFGKDESKQIPASNTPVIDVVAKPNGYLNQFTDKQPLPEFIRPTNYVPPNFDN